MNRRHKGERRVINVGTDGYPDLWSLPEYKRIRKGAPMRIRVK